MGVTERPPAPAGGLCDRCRHSEVIVSDRGSRFIRCALSAADPAFAKYPRLPVISCRGFAATSDTDPRET